MEFLNRLMNIFSFTLLEILITITIISILAAILMPSLEKAREKGRQAVCMNNLKQVGVAILLYAQDYNGWGPPPNTSEPKYWSEILIENNYASKSKIFVCPSFGKWSYTYYKTQTYGISEQFKILSVENPSNTLLAADSKYGENQSFYIGKASNTRRIHIRHLGKANILFCDGHVESRNSNELTFSDGSWTYFE